MMDWKQSVDGTPYWVQLLANNEPGALAWQDNAQAVENIQELAKGVAYWVLTRPAVREATRWENRDDAVQEACLILMGYAHLQPLHAYGIARRRLWGWMVRRVWGLPRYTPKEQREGVQRRVWGPSLDAFEQEPLFLTRSAQPPTPEELLLAEEEGPELPEGCEEVFFNICYDLVVNHMRVARRRHHVALNDATVLTIALRGGRVPEIAQEMGCDADLARQRLRYARRRLVAFCEEQGGVEAVAAQYRAGAAVTDVRALHAFVAEYVGQRRAAWCAEQGEERPGRRRVEKWKEQARACWAKRQVVRAVAAD